MSKTRGAPILPSGVMTWVRRLGLLLSMACCVWVARVLWQEFANNGLSIEPSRLLLPFLLAVGGGVMVNACLGVIWHQLVVAQGEAISLRDSIGLSWRVQIAKYIPGNIFHFAGRVMVAERFGVSRGVATRATLLEPVLMVVVAGLISQRWLAELTGWGWIPPLVLLLAGVVGAGILIRNRFAQSASFESRSWNVSGKQILILLATTGGLFALLALMFGLFIPLVETATPRSWSAVGEMVTVSWTVGFVAVGAPGGLGVREATLILFASSPADADALLFIGVLTRSAMLAGDAVSMLLGALMLGKDRPRPLNQADDKAALSKGAAGELPPR
ncbi:MAG: lysylphosphatidylglycerol synthase domain-containing protein [Synoicihabitans sp.]